MSPSILFFIAGNGYNIIRIFTFLNAEFLQVNKYHKMFVDKWYLILYQIKDNTVYVDYIENCRQDYKWLVQ